MHIKLCVVFLHLPGMHSVCILLKRIVPTFIYLRVQGISSIHGPPDANAGCWEIIFSSRNNTEEEDSMHVDLCLTINVQNMAEADRKCQMSWLS